MQDISFSDTPSDGRAGLERQTRGTPHSCAARTPSTVPTWDAISAVEAVHHAEMSFTCRKWRCKQRTLLDAKTSFLTKKHSCRCKRRLRSQNCVSARKQCFSAVHTAPMRKGSVSA